MREHDIEQQYILFITSLKILKVNSMMIYIFNKTACFKQFKSSVLSKLIFYFQNIISLVWQSSELLDSLVNTKILLLRFVFVIIVFRLIE